MVFLSLSEKSWTWSFSMNSGILVGFIGAAHPAINKIVVTLMTLQFSLFNIRLLDLKKQVSKFWKSN